MRKQNVSLQNEHGMHVRWLAPAEAERLEKDGQARRISKRKDPKPIYRLNSFPDASKSAPSNAALTSSDIDYLSLLPKNFVERLDASKIRKLHPGRLQRLQRLAGHGLIRSAAIENAGEGV